MVAHADDLRYWYSEVLGDSIQKTITAAATPTELRSGALEPGRYAMRILDFGTATSLWVRQGAAGSVGVTNGAPSTQFFPPPAAVNLNIPILYFMVRPGPTTQVAGGNTGALNMLEFWAVGGTGVIVQVTKISRDKA